MQYGTWYLVSGIGVGVVDPRFGICGLRLDMLGSDDWCMIYEMCCVRLQFGIYVVLFCEFGVWDSGFAIWSLGFGV